MICAIKRFGDPVRFEPDSYGVLKGNDLIAVCPTRKKADEVAQGLVAVNPPKGMEQAYPLMLYFDSQETARDFVRMVQQYKPDLFATNDPNGQTDPPPTG